MGRATVQCGHGKGCGRGECAVGVALCGGYGSEWQPPAALRARSKFEFSGNKKFFGGTSKVNSGVDSIPSSASGGGSSQSGMALPGINLQEVTKVIGFTANPLTRGVTAQLVLR